MTKQELIVKLKNHKPRNATIETIIELAFDEGVRSQRIKDGIVCDINECKIFCLKDHKHYNMAAGVCGRRNIVKDGQIKNSTCLSCKFYNEQSGNCHSIECQYRGVKNAR